MPCARGEINRQAGQENKPEKYCCCRSQLPATKEQRDRNQWTKLPGRTQCGDRDTDRGFRFAGVAKDRQQGAQSCGAQGDADDHGSLRRGGQDEASANACRQGDDPASRRTVGGPAADYGEINLVAGNEEEHGQPEFGQCIHELGGLDPPQQAGAEQDSEDNLEHHDRHLDHTIKKAGRKGRCDSQQGDQNQ